MAREGREFITHEFDEAIAIQQSLLECERQLADVHPMEETRSELQDMLRTDEQQLRTLKELGRPFGATGRREDVAEHLDKLGTEVSKGAKDASDADKYEMHAVVLTMKRKQQDSAQAMARIAREVGDDRLRDEATSMHKEAKAAAEQLAKSLTFLAADLATRGEDAAGSGRAAGQPSSRSAGQRRTSVRTR